MPRKHDTEEIEPQRRGGRGSDDRDPEEEEARIGRAHPRDLDPEDEEVIGRPRAIDDRFDGEDTVRGGVAYRPMDRPAHAREQADEEELDEDDIIEELDLDDLERDD